MNQTRVFCHRPGLFIAWHSGIPWWRFSMLCRDEDVTSLLITGLEVSWGRGVGR